MKALWFLHGNLQQPQVWQPFTSYLNSQHLELQTTTVSLWETVADSSWSWAWAFCDRVRNHPTPVVENYIVGYSLGGRLAMHTLLTAPELWSGAIVISAAPGIAEQYQKEQQIRCDRTWANRFLTDPWYDLLAEWDALPVFCGRPCMLKRSESDFDRQKIAHAFEAYSKGYMEHLTPRLQTLTVPITYITGLEDQRYCELGQTLSAQCPHLTHIEVPEAGHRVPWEQPDAFLSILIDSLSR